MGAIWSSVWLAMAGRASVGSTATSDPSPATRLRSIVKSPTVAVAR